MKWSLRVIGATLLSVPILFYSYVLGENKPVHTSGSPKTQKEQVERLSPEQLKQMKKGYEQLISRISKDIKEAVNKTSVTPQRKKPPYTRNDLSDEVLKSENFVFNQDVSIREKKVKTRLGVKLNETRDLESITTDISYQNVRVQTNYNAANKRHTIKGSGKVAGFKTTVVLDSERKPVFAASRTIKVADIGKLTTSGGYNFESKNLGLGLVANTDFIGASVSMNLSPKASITDYNLRGNIGKDIRIDLHSREARVPGVPDSARRSYDGKLTTTLIRNVSLQAGAALTNGSIVNPSIRINYSFKK